MNTVGTQKAKAISVLQIQLLGILYEKVFCKEVNNAYSKNGSIKNMFFLALILTTLNVKLLVLVNAEFTYLHNVFG